MIPFVKISLFLKYHLCSAALMETFQAVKSCSHFFGNAEVTECRVALFFFFWNVEVTDFFLKLQRGDRGKNTKPLQTYNAQNNSDGFIAL